MAIKSSVTISLVPEARGGPFVFWDDLAACCRQAAELGFDGVEVFAPGPEALGGDLPGLLKKHHLILAAAGTGGGWVQHRLTLTSGDASVRERARAFVRAMIDAAGVLGAPAIIGSMQGRWGDDVDRSAALEYVADALSELGEYARRYNVPLLYEPLNRYETNLITTLAEGVEFLRTLATANVRLLADLFHMNIEEANLAAALRVAGGHVGHIHFVDSNRRPAGLGHLDYGPIAAALRDVAYDGFLSAEALPYPSPIEAARQTITAYRQFFTAGAVG
jgi:sugar phosphate isomerase/epimerase